MPTKFVKKSQLDYLRNITNKKIMLSERDNILLSVATLLGLSFSIAQYILGGVTALLIFVPLLIVGWIIPLSNYISRVVRKLPFRKSLIEHFRSWIYLCYGLVFYISISIAGVKNIESWILVAVFVISFSSFTFILTISAKRFFKLFGCKKSFNFWYILQKGYFVVVLSFILFYSILLFSLGYFLYQSPVAPLSFIGGSALLAISISSWIYDEGTMNARQFMLICVIITCIAFILIRFFKSG